MSLPAEMTDPLRVLTVTPNTALDQVYTLTQLEPGRRNQAVRCVRSMGGKGCNVALVLRHFGLEVAATGFVSGAVGREVVAWMAAAGVTTDFVEATGESRVNTVLLERSGEMHTTVCAPGLQAGPGHWEALAERIRLRSATAAVTVIAGSMPEGADATAMTQLLRSCRSPVVVDASGASLATAVEEGVAAVKPNLHELESLFGSLPTQGSRVDAAESLRTRGAGIVLLSLGAEGAILASEAGVWTAPGVPVIAENPAGAGDSMTAMLARGIPAGWSAPEILRRAVAAATAVVITPGTAELDPLAAERFVDSVRVTCVLTR